jgi:quercetin dioxygenase-like cupin family protein
MSLKKSFKISTMLNIITKENESLYQLPSKPDQLAFISPKVWGHEEWIVNNAQYCGKKLVFKAGYCCSLHYHKIKEETFYILSGKVFIDIEENGVKKSRIMTPGEIQHIPQGIIHRITALEDAQVIEFSTFHMEDDSYRIIPAGKADLQALGLDPVVIKAMADRPELNSG